MGVDTSEKDFERTIEEVLLSGGVALAPGGAGIVSDIEAELPPESPRRYRQRRPEHYDKALCLDTRMLFNFIFATQIETWNKLKEQHGEQVRTRFLKRLVHEIETRGTLDVLRKGVIDLGCKFELACFRPESRLNPEHRRKYNANVFSVIRQLHYSQTGSESIDLVIFLNGLPIFTAELKNREKGQTVEDAIKQYWKDRDPKEPLLRFGRCLAHFAVDTDLVYMTTRLQKAATGFLPFNKGHERAAGNPPNPKGFKTAYLWEEVWQRDSILEIVQHYLQLVDVLDEDGKPTGEKKLIFPRYHQLDTVRRLVVHASANGPGQSYLVEHSAGSGKSNTIAWLAHQFAGLHDAGDQRVFDSIIVVTDRRVIDRQLQQTVRSFEQTRGLVSCMEKQKAKELAQALAEGKDIIVTTLQTFPFVTERITEIKGKNFGVLIDEAHSSQTGETARTMKRTLAAAGEQGDDDDSEEGEPPDPQDEINQRIEELMKQSGRLPNVSFFAFTATPKNRTLELFGTRQPEGTFLPFSLYSMRQAIEERFILDVLQNYTTFRVYFALHKKIAEDPKYPKKKSMALMKSYVNGHEHNLRSKTDIIVEHFDEQVKDRIKGQAKAMVVTRSRLQAVRYKRMFDRVLAEQKLPYKALVAFSGTVKDPDSGAEFTEPGMNGFPESRTAAMFRKLEYRFLIVAEKFQTGFDQPLLHTMYVDKKLSGLNAVQTLSRLNRTLLPDKEDTMVLDFINEPKHIQQAFQPYYETTQLMEATDPNKLYDLKRKVEEFAVFQKADVEAFAKEYFSEKGSQARLRAMLDPVVEHFNRLDREDETTLLGAVNDYVRLYAFLSHILRFTDVDLEKSYQFLRHLRPLLRLPLEALPREVTAQIDMESYRIKQTSTGTIALMSEDGELHPAEEIGTGRDEDETMPLSEIIEYINENFGTDFTDEDKVNYFAQDMQRRLADRDGLRQALNPEINPSEENQRLAFDQHFNDVLEDMIDANTDIYKKIVEDPRFGDVFRKVMFRKIIEALRKESA